MSFAPGKATPRTIGDILGKDVLIVEDIVDKEVEEILEKNSYDKDSEPVIDEEETKEVDKSSTVEEGPEEIADDDSVTTFRELRCEEGHLPRNHADLKHNQPRNKYKSKDTTLKINAQI